MATIESLTSKLLSKLNQWLESLVTMLPNLAVAILIVLVAVMLAKGARSVVRRGISRITQNQQLSALFSNLAHMAVIFGGGLFALGTLNLDKTVTSALAGVGVVGLALGFAFQDIASNFVSGILMAFRRPFRSGDLVKTNDFFGTVQGVSLRTTELRTLSGEHVIIPNKEVLQKPIINYTNSPERRVEVPVGVSYGDDLVKVREVVLKAVEGIETRDERLPVEVFYTGFGSSSIDFELRFWLINADQLTYLKARSEAIMAIKRAFDENDITIPFPIRTLDFSSVGGQTLVEVAREVEGSPLGTRRGMKHTTQPRPNQPPDGGAIVSRAG